MILEYFPPAAQALNLEVRSHPVLLAILQNNGPMDMETMIGHVAAYCNVELDGYYMEEDLEALFILLIDRLRNKSAIVVN
jgi:hypothetical protein